MYYFRLWTIEFCCLCSIMYGCIHIFTYIYIREYTNIFCLVCTVRYGTIKSFLHLVSSYPIIVCPSVCPPIYLWKNLVGSVSVQIVNRTLLAICYKTYFCPIQWYGLFVNKSFLITSISFGKSNLSKLVFFDSYNSTVHQEK